MKKRILFINGHMNCGGVEKALLNVLNHFNYEKYDVDLLLLEEIGDYESEIPENVNLLLKALTNTYGALWKSLVRCVCQRDWFSMKMRIVFLAKRIFGQRILFLTKRLFDLPKYDTVIAFRSGICTQIAAYAVDADKKYTWWHHGEINVNRGEYLEVIKSFEKVIVVSNPCLAMLQEAFPEMKHKFVVIPNLIDVEEIRQKAREKNVEPEKTNDAVQIVTVSRISREKHVDSILYSARRLKEKGLNFCWTIIGEGSLRSEIESRVEKEHLGEFIRFLGTISNPYPVLASADLYVHPSYVESQGIAVLEALSLNIPCVVTDSLGPKEYLENERNALVAAKGDKELFEAVFRIIQNRDLYDSIKLHSNCPPQYQPETVMKQIEQLL